MARRIQCDTIAQNNGNSISESATATDENKNERPIDSSGERKSINFGGKKMKAKRMVMNFDGKTREITSHFLCCCFVQWCRIRSSMMHNFIRFN